MYAREGRPLERLTSSLSLPPIPASLLREILDTWFVGREDEGAGDWDWGLGLATGRA